MIKPIDTILSRYGLCHADKKPSRARFSDDSHFGVELSSANTPEILDRMLELARRFEVRVNRFIECRGISRLTDSDIRRMVRTCAEHEAGLYLSLGSRATYGCGAFSRSKNGARQGYRTVGVSGLQFALEEVLRAYGLGVRGFLIYDEGVLWLLGQARKDGLLPQDAKLKFSVHAGCSNPAAAQLMSRLGADSLNLVPDLPIQEIFQVRKSVPCPLDLFTDTSADAGGLIRTHEVADFVTYASPVYLKCGPISQPHQNHLPTDSELTERVRQTKCVLEHLGRSEQSVTQVTAAEKTLAIPSLDLSLT